jgi:hypothetical protein
VYPGKFVKEGELIGYSDSKGNSTGNHVHDEIRVDGKVVDPNKFDYTFNGMKGGAEEVNISDKQDKVRVIVGMLYVRAGPAKMYPVSGSKVLRKGDIVNVIGFTEGESVDGNNLWYKSIKGNYFWAGGTDKPLPVEDKKDMTLQENEAKKQEFEARKVAIEARRVELENAVEANKADAEAFQRDFEAFMAEPIEEPVVEEPVLDVPAVEEVKEEVQVSEEDKGIVARLEEELKALKAKLGL